MGAQWKSTSSQLAVIGFNVVSLGAEGVVVMDGFSNSLGVPRCSPHIKFPSDRLGAQTEPATMSHMHWKLVRLG